MACTESTKQAKVQVIKSEVAGFPDGSDGKATFLYHAPPYFISREV